MVRARTGASGSDYFWDSPVDSGHSVDDIAPTPIGGMDGRYADGVTQLTWTPCTAAALVGYVAYRGGSPGFVLSAASRVGTTRERRFTDETGAVRVCNVTAIDSHGNQSAAIAFPPDVEIGAMPAGAVLIFAPRPNPARELATICYILPRAGRAALVICDLSGRVVRGWDGESQEAGGGREVR